MLALILSTISGFLCTSIALPLSQALRLRRGYGIWTWSIHLVQLISGVIILAELALPGSLHFIDASSTNTFRVVLGFLAGILCRLTLALLFQPISKPSRIVHPNGTPFSRVEPSTPNYTYYIGPVFVIIILLSVGALTPHLDRLFASLQSIDTPWASLTFAAAQSPERFDIEDNGQPSSVNNLHGLIDLRAAVSRDAQISRRFPDSQEAQFHDTWPAAILFFDRYIAPLSSCVTLLYQQNKSEKEIEFMIRKIPPSLHRLIETHALLRQYSDQKSIDQSQNSYEKSWKLFIDDLNEILYNIQTEVSPIFLRHIMATSDDSEACIDHLAQRRFAIRPSVISAPHEQLMDEETFGRVIHNPYFTIALSVLHAVTGDFQTSRDVLESSAVDGNGHSPSLLLALLNSTIASGAHFLDYADTQKWLIESLEVRLSLVQSGNVYELGNSFCGTVAEALRYYGGALYHATAQKNNFVFEVTRLLNSDYDVAQSLLDAADRFALFIKDFADTIDQRECAMRPQFERSRQDAALFRASLLDTYAVYKITRSQGTAAGISEHIETLQKALRYAQASSASAADKARPLSLISRHLTQARRFF